MNTGKKFAKTCLLGVIWMMMVGCTVLTPDQRSAGQADPKIDELTVRDILDATIQINMYVLTSRENLSQDPPNIEEARAHLDQGRGHYRVEGLGTLIDLQRQTMILTHDHWGELLHSADLIEIRDADGNPIRSMSSQEFHGLVVFADRGTMILKAPKGL